MRARIDVKTGFPVFDLEKKDIADARAIRKMTETRGFKILLDYWKSGRETLIDYGKNGIKSRAKKDLSPERWAVLYGYDECVLLVSRIIGRLEKIEEEQINERYEPDDE